MARKKKNVDGDELRGDEWMATFSDTITLLLTFFILLYSFSSVDQKKLKEISSALQSVLIGQKEDSILEYNSGNVLIVGEDTTKDIAEKMGANEIMYEKVKQFVEENNLSAIVEIKEDERGIILQLKDNILFESGKADLIVDSKGILDKISSLLATLPNTVIVEGHTDNIPINTYKFESNWDLSTARAVNVIRYFTEVKGIDGKRCSAAGFGEYKPLVDNSTNENRAKNRRVNILIVATEKEKK